MLSKSTSNPIEHHYQKFAHNNHDNIDGRKSNHNNGTVIWINANTSFDPKIEIIIVKYYIINSIEKQFHVSFIWKKN